MKHLLMRIGVSANDTKALYDDRFAFDTLLSACWKAGCHVCTSVTHGFHPQGFTAAVILAESHATIHTYPEEGYALVDYFSCAEDAHFDFFMETWKAEGFEILFQEIVDRKRGVKTPL
jgi:S-adenosylmethionine decarboxylase proenzyme